MAKEDKRTGTNSGISILVAGPECSGKTTLCKYISQKYNAFHLPEYAVSYLYRLDRTYDYTDLLAIAKNHYKSYLEAISDNEVVFVDSFLLNLKIWSNYRFGKVDNWIQSKLEQLNFDLVLLLEPNLEWEMAAFRENPADRNLLYEYYVEEMNSLQWKYKRINKLGGERIYQAESYLLPLINSKK